MNLKSLWRRYLYSGLPPLTVGLIALSVLITFLFQYLQIEAILRIFLISQYSAPAGGLFAGLPEIREGQVWRLVTPIFLHFNVLHLVFNMLWLWELGGMIERNQSHWSLLWLVLAFAVGSNLAQYAMSGPAFGGMSGVVYGLLGYAWIRGHFDPRSALFVPQPIVIMMVAWFVICLTGLLGPIANTAHGVGLALGMAWGWLSARGSS